MPTASRPSFLRHFGRTPRRQPDFGDMGTAFGLDQAMDGMEYDASSRTVAAPVAVAAGGVRAASWRIWLGRKFGA